MNNNYLTIDTEELKLIVPPGLSAPKDRIDYNHPKVQSILKDAFGNIFPNIVAIENDGIAYQLVDDRGYDRCINSEPVINISDIPKAELLRLMEGWIKMRRRLAEGDLNKNLESIMLNFRVPNPRKSIQRYHLERKGNEKKLIILWGYESDDAPTVSIEKALSTFLDVPTGHLQSILSTSLTPNSSRITNSVSVDTKMIKSLQNTSDAKETDQGNSLAKQKNIKMSLVTAGMTGALTMTAVILFTVMATKNKNSAITDTSSDQQKVQQSDHPTLEDDVRARYTKVEELKSVHTLMVKPTEDMPLAEKQNSKKASRSQTVKSKAPASSNKTNKLSPVAIGVNTTNSQKLDTQVVSNDDILNIGVGIEEDEDETSSVNDEINELLEGKTSNNILDDLL